MNKIRYKESEGLGRTVPKIQFELFGLRHLYEPLSFSISADRSNHRGKWFCHGCSQVQFSLTPARYGYYFLQVKKQFLKSHDWNGKSYFFLVSMESTFLRRSVQPWEYEKAIVTPDGITSCIMEPYAARRHEKWMYRRSKVGERLRKYLTITPFPSLECYAIYCDPAYKLPTENLFCPFDKKCKQDCNASVSKAHISVEWEFAECCGRCGEPNVDLESGSSSGSEDATYHGLMETSKMAKRKYEELGDLKKVVALP
ncbi:hypothetical protein BD770DRAFT_415731 [Pilaira anomala]|nr:hypothetical protein BD770DRAFT_415731 [Pilaira anomala]